MAVATNSPTREGFVYGLGAYLSWGLIPLYFKAVSSVSPLHVVAHRVVWSFLFLALLMTLWGRWSELRPALQSSGVIRRLALSTLLIAVNWFTFIFAVSNGQVLQSSLGYFVTPLLNVVLGVLFLHERLRPIQTLSVLMAAAGMLNLALVGKEFPWIALSLAVSFAGYGFLRKTVAADGLLGLFVETMLLVPPAAAYLLFLHLRDGGQGAFSDRAAVNVLLLSSGVVTALPLLMFASAARRLRLATLGFMQYIAPSVQFLVAILIFREPFSRTQFASFACIWGALGIYTLDSAVTYWRARGDDDRP